MYVWFDVRTSEFATEAISLKYFQLQHRLFRRIYRELKHFHLLRLKKQRNCFVREKVKLH